MFYTVQELMAQIKGWEYIIAILFLGLFIGYCSTLSREPKGRKPPQPTRIVSLPLQRRYPAGGRDSTRLSFGAPIIPCWEARKCPPEVREDCPAYALSPLPCWVVRPLVSGKNWEPCATCPIRAQGMERLIEATRKSRPARALPGDPPAG